MIGVKGFRSFHWTRGTSSRKVMEACQGRTSCVCGKKEKRKRRCEEEFLVLMCGEVLMGSVYEKMKHGMELWVASYRSEASGLLV